ncbi:MULTISPECIES: lipopolysaccharide biosynthesis protein [Pseudomonas]|nr:lipopolysaccharide biosynthesis protein [Pseudomonas mosselii]
MNSIGSSRYKRVLSRFLPKHGSARNVITLMTGTALGQAIPVAISPLLTRLYSPAEFGVFALYMALVAVLSVLATGRYELAIMVPRSERSAAAIVALAIACCAGVSALLLLIILVFHDQLVVLFNLAGSTYWLYWVPLSVMLMGANQSLNYWCNRHAYYKRMSTTRIAQNTGMSTAHVALGYGGLGMLGLIIGAVLGYLTAFSLLFLASGRRKLFTGMSIARMHKMARRHVDFPKFLVLAHGFNMASFQSPVVLLGSFFGSSVAGFFMLTQRVIGAPMSIVAGAIGDVFRQQASERYARTGECVALYRKTFVRLLILSLPPFAVFYVVAPDFFAWVFGEAWRVSGEYARVLAPMLFFQFITSPLSCLFFIAGKQRLDLLWQSGLFVTVCGSLVLGGVSQDVGLALHAFSYGYCILYIINGVMTYRFAKGRGVSLNYGS